jgi:hypothetical protein
MAQFTIEYRSRIRNRTIKLGAWEGEASTYEEAIASYYPGHEKKILMRIGRLNVRTFKVFQGFGNPIEGVVGRSWVWHGPESQCGKQVRCPCLLWQAFLIRARPSEPKAVAKELWPFDSKQQADFIFWAEKGYPFGFGLLGALVNPEASYRDASALKVSDFPTDGWKQRHRAKEKRYV